MGSWAERQLRAAIYAGLSVVRGKDDVKLRKLFEHQFAARPPGKHDHGRWDGKLWMSRDYVRTRYGSDRLFDGNRTFTNNLRTFQTTAGAYRRGEKAPDADAQAFLRAIGVPWESLRLRFPVVVEKRDNVVWLRLDGPRGVRVVSSAERDRMLREKLAASPAPGFTNASITFEGVRERLPSRMVLAGPEAAGKTIGALLLLASESDVLVVRSGVTREDLDLFPRHPVLFDRARQTDVETILGAAVTRKRVIVTTRDPHLALDGFEHLLVRPDVRYLDRLCSVLGKRLGLDIMPAEARDIAEEAFLHEQPVSFAGACDALLRAISHALPEQSARALALLEECQSSVPEREVLRARDTLAALPEVRARFVVAAATLARLSSGTAKRTVLTAFLRDEGVHIDMVALLAWAEHDRWLVAIGDDIYVPPRVLDAAQELAPFSAASPTMADAVYDWIGRGSTAIPPNDQRSLVDAAVAEWQWALWPGPTDAHAFGFSDRQQRRLRSLLHAQLRYATGDDLLRIARALASLGDVATALSLMRRYEEHASAPLDNWASLLECCRDHEVAATVFRRIVNEICDGDGYVPSAFMLACTHLSANEQPHVLRDVLRDLSDEWRDRLIASTNGLLDARDGA